jgi:maltose alpha-D-glucosyltransferase / alpha-amylase
MSEGVITGNGAEALWYKDAIIYETHVRAFFDSNGDGKGDFQGLTAKLDYIQDLGATTVWVLPFYPSPWRDDGYDISQYTDVHPAYGTLRDFQAFLREAHRRGLRVIIELVLNHTSDQHPWFQRARHAKPGSRQREFYVWSDTPDKYKEARIIFKDFQTSNWTWDPVAKAYYWHRFYAHQPDLNFDHPLVRRSMFRVVDYWLDQGVDGLRLDAVPYLFEREGTICENLPETHAFLKELRTHVDSKYPNRMLLAEANMWPEDAAIYLSGDECHMAFHFPLMPRLFTALQMEDRFPIMEILRQTPPIPETSQWALFLRNHDELTLEMVTDEERDYMYRMYAQDPQTRINLGIRRRLAPLLANDRRRIELMNALLFALPGTPVIYYGDEIGMGDNVYLGDRNGVRTPMQWSADRNAGFSRANPQQLYLPVNIDPEYHFEAVNVEIQQNTAHSLFWWMKRLVTIRKQFRAFGRGTLEFIQPDNRRVLAFCRKYEEERILLVANLSRFVQDVGLDLAQFKELTPVEMFGRSELPAVADGLYHITLGPYAFYWLSLEDRRVSIEAVPGAPGPPQTTFEISSLSTPFDYSMRAAMAQYLPRFLKTRRWFKGRDRRVESISFPDIISLRPTSAYILITRVEYADGDAETYVLFASVATGDEMEKVQADSPDAVAVRLRAGDGKEGILYSSIWDKSFAKVLMEAIARRRRFKGEAGEFSALPFRFYREILGTGSPSLEPGVNKASRTNNSFVFGDRFVLKLFRSVEPGIHPEIEIGRFLAEQTAFTNIAPIAGRLEYVTLRGEAMALGVLQGFVQSEADAWHYTMDSLSRFFERTQTQPGNSDDSVFSARGKPLLAVSADDAPPAIHELIGEYLERSRLLGQRTAELHLALAGNTSDPNFSPEPLSEFYRQGLYHAMLSLFARTCQALRHALGSLPESTRTAAQRVLGLDEAIRARLRLFRDSSMTGSRIRLHGNYNLSEVLYTGKDFVIVDFEGDPARRLTERRLKRPPFSDVASMLVSFHDAAHASPRGEVPGVIHEPADPASSLRWADLWYRWVAAAFLKGYMASMGSTPLLPGTEQETQTLLNVLLLERFISEAEQFLGEDRDGLMAPLTGILRVVEDWPAADVRDR